MLQFLKKPGPVPIRTENGLTDHHLARIQSAEEQCLNSRAAGPEHDDETKSRLFHSLPDILNDQACLCYFVQYMEAEDALPWIKFWLAVENFKLSAQTMIDLQTIGEGPELLSSTKSSCDVDAEEQGEAQATTTNCDIEDRPLTDDEKSEIIQSDKQAKRRLEGEKTAEWQKSQRRRRSKRNSQFQTTVATDAIKIFEKFLCSSSDSCLSDIPATIHSKISLSMCDCDEETLVSPFCFAEAQQFAVERMERQYQRQFLDSEFYCKYCVEILTGADLRLSDILYSECVLFYFMEFLEQEQKRDYLDFWMSATNFRRHSADPSANCPLAERRSDAMVLYDKYFSLQATNPLSLSDGVRSQVEERICSADERVLVTSFDGPIRIVEQLFRDFYLERFLASELFYKYLTELVHRSQGQSQRHARVQRTQSLTKERATKSHRRCSSGGELLRRANSTISISSQNTLLAMESPCARPLQEPDLDIDSRMLFNSELLWKRPQNQASSSLSFGRVNALGRFERDFEWDEVGEERHKSTGSRIKKAVKKFVNLPEDKVQEELAWQVAEMIIKDVTDITMNGRAAQSGAPVMGPKEAEGVVS